jgi:peptide/nickel transport system substrate-binding protein
MNKQVFYRRLFQVTALLVLLLMLAACGVPSTEPAAPDAPAEAATGGEDAEAEPTEEAEEEDEAAAQTQAVQGAESSQTQVVGGVTVTTDEDVTTQREDRGGEYRASTTTDFVSFHPYKTTDTASSGAQGNVWDGSLLTLDEHTLQYEPYMAKSYTVSEDGLTYTFELHDNLTWSDGTPLTAQDFVWTYEQVIKPENEYPYLSNFEDIVSYQALDDYTLEVKIAEAFCPALTTVSSAITPLPQHIWEELDWNDPETNPEINSPSVISGPYRIVNWQRDQFAEYEANESYWYHGAPNITRRITEIVPDPDISYEKMKSGETDTGVITPDNLEEARQLENITVYEWWPAAAQWSYVGLNLRQEGRPTMDINVRHALSYAIDKDQLTEEVMEGQAKRLCSAFPETSWAFSADVECYDYDPEQAIALFEEAGYSYDGTTMLTPEGEPLVLKLIYGPNTSKTLELESLFIQANLADIGIQVEIQSMEWASFLEATDAADPDWDMFLGAWRATIEPHYMYQIWSEENIPSLNSVGFINPEVEQLFEDASRNCDVEYRKEVYGEIQRIIAEESPYIFLFYNKAWQGINNRIEGIEPTPLGIGYNYLDWHVSEAQQQ